MKTIDISICAGVNCNKAQATWLKQFEQIISPQMKNRIHLFCGTCEHRCTSDLTNAPCVKVNEQVYPRATPAQIKREILKVA